MAAALVLIAAFLFALAATLQQKGALNLPTNPVVSIAIGTILLNETLATDAADEVAPA